MTSSKIGGSGSENLYLYIYVIGVFLGTLIRMIVFIIPIGIVHRLEGILLPDNVTIDNSQRFE
jgi:hypothetical protein